MHLTLQRAIRLSYYTITDYGIWNSIAAGDRTEMKVVLDGKTVRKSQADFFLNPAFAVRSATKMSESLLAASFMDFLGEPYLQDDIVPRFKVLN